MEGGLSGIGALSPWTLRTAECKDDTKKIKNYKSRISQTKGKRLFRSFCRQLKPVQCTHHVILPCIVSDSLVNMIKTKDFK